MMCVCALPMLASFVKAWQQHIRKHLLPDGPLRSVYNRGHLILQMCSPDLPSRWFALPVINLVTLTGSVLELHRAPDSDLRARAERAAGYEAYLIVTYEISLSNAALGVPIGVPFRGVQ